MDAIDTIKLTIDGRKITASHGQTVLEAALASGIYIPHLCTHPGLPVQGNCNLCVVEIVGGEHPRGGTIQQDSAHLRGGEHIAKACDTVAAAGMNIVTKTAALAKARSIALELMLAGHPKDCTSCKAYLNCELQSLMQYLGVVSARMRPIHRETININVKNPLIIREMERCIQCGRCVRACGELRGVDALQYNKHGWETYIGTEKDVPLADAGCRFCGACVEVCPTGALIDPEGLFRKDIPRAEALVPCGAECPAGIDVPRYTRYIKEGNHSAAAAVVRERAPFPHVLGYVCNRRCETVCKRSKLNEAVSIRDLKRFAVENDDQRVWLEKYTAPPATETGKTVAVVGSGPCGLTAAYYLRKKGHTVTVLERLSAAGGMMVAGMPEYRLPGNVAAREVDIICRTGVKIITDCNVTLAAVLKGKYDSVLIAIGAWRGKKLSTIPGSESAGVFTAIDMLRASRFGESLALGNTVNIIGGGNVAYDCARTLIRMGKRVNIICLEKRDAMLADEEEITEGAEEGVCLSDGSVSVGIESTEGRVTGHKIISVDEFHFDEDRTLVMRTVEGSERILNCDSIIFAAGQEPDIDYSFGLELNRFGYPVVGDDRVTTSIDGVFAAGDVVTGTKFVITAIEVGRCAASAIDRYLGGDGDILDTLIRSESEHGDSKIGRLTGFAEMARETPVHRSSDTRTADFEPISECLSCAQAKREAERCLQCDLRKQISNVKLWTAYAAAGRGEPDMSQEAWHREPTGAPQEAGRSEPPDAPQEASRGDSFSRLDTRRDDPCSQQETQKLECCIGVELLPDANEIFMAQGQNKGTTDKTCPVEQALKVADIARMNNCGKHVMCRDGMQQLYTIIHDFTTGKGQADDAELLRDICDVISQSKGCELAVRSSELIMKSFELYSDDWLAHIRRKRCAAGICYDSPVSAAAAAAASGDDGEGMRRRRRKV